MNDMHFLIYTTEEGGFFHVMRFTPEKFKRLRETGQLRLYNPSKDEWSTIEPPLIALAQVKDNYDFELKRSRDFPAP